LHNLILLVVFTFTEKPVLQILHYYLPFARYWEGVAVYFSADIADLGAIHLRIDMVSTFKTHLKIEDSSVFNDLRSVKTPYSWIRKEDIPFDIKHEVKVQMDIFNELNNNIFNN